MMWSVSASTGGERSRRRGGAALALFLLTILCSRLEALDVKPHLALRAGERYDSNTLMQNQGPSAFRSSWVTSVLPTLGMRLEPGKEDPDLTVGLTYAPDFSIFHDQKEESYNRHIGILEVQAGKGNWQFDTDAKLSYTDGSELMPVWIPPSVVPALGAVEARDRRRMFLYSQRASLRCGWGSWFARLEYDGRLWNFMTVQQQVPFYQNTSDRSDFNGGPDVGREVMEGLHAFLGYRLGYQDEQRLPFRTSLTHRNVYHRILPGIEGSPAKWITLDARIGPSLHIYTPNGVGPNQPTRDTLLYLRVSMTVRAGKKTRLRFNGWQYLLPSSAGENVYQNIGFRAACEHRFNDCLLARLIFDIKEFDFLPPIPRRDRSYTPGIELEYTFKQRFTVGGFYSYARAVNLANPLFDNREYTRHIAGGFLRARY